MVARCLKIPKYHLILNWHHCLIYIFKYLTFYQIWHSFFFICSFWSLSAILVLVSRFVFTGSGCVNITKFSDKIKHLEYVFRNRQCCSDKSRHMLHQSDFTNFKMLSRDDCWQSFVRRIQKRNFHWELIFWFHDSKPNVWSLIYLNHLPRALSRHFHFNLISLILLIF